MLLRDKVQEQHSHLGRHFYDRERGREGGREGRERGREDGREKRGESPGGLVKLHYESLTAAARVAGASNKE